MHGPPGPRAVSATCGAPRSAAKSVVPVSALSRPSVARYRGATERDARRAGDGTKLEQGRIHDRLQLRRGPREQLVAGATLEKACQRSVSTRRPAHDIVTRAAWTAAGLGDPWSADGRDSSPAASTSPVRGRRVAWDRGANKRDVRRGPRSHAGSAGPSPRPRGVFPDSGTARRRSRSRGPRSRVRVDEAFSIEPSAAAHRS